MGALFLSPLLSSIYAALDSGTPSGDGSTHVASLAGGVVGGALVLTIFSVIVHISLRVCKRKWKKDNPLILERITW